MRLEGCSTRDEAEGYRGALLSIPELEAIIAEGQFLPDALVGLEVVSARGEHLGEVTDVLDYPAQEILEVRTKRGSRLIPFVRELVPSVDIDGGLMTLDAGVDLESFFGIGSDESGDSGS